MSQSLVHSLQVLPGMSLARLMGLTGAVLAVHLLLLGAPSLDFDSHQASSTGRALNTRTIAPPSPTLVPPAPVARRAAPAPKPRARSTKPRLPAQPIAEPVPAAAPGGTAVAEPPPELSVLGPTPTEPVATVEPSPEPALEGAAERPPRDDGPSARIYKFPLSARLSYDIEADRFPYTASAEMVWQHDGKNYQASMAIRKLVTVRSQTSVGSIGADGLMPTRFADKSRGEVAAHFDREGGKVTFSANTPEAALLTATQDQLSLPLQLAAMVAGEPEKFGQGTTITIQVVGPRHASLWLLTVEGTQMLTLPIGEVTTLKLQRNPRQPYDQKVELWLAPDHGYLPARIRLTDANGAFLDQKLQSIEGLH